MADRTRAQFERELLPRFMQRQRWFAGKDESVADHPLLDADGHQWLLTLVDTHGTAPARYFVPLSIAFEDDDEERTRALAPHAVSRVRQQAAVGVLADAMGDEAFCRALVEAIGARRELSGETGSVHFVPAAIYREVVGKALDGPLPMTRLTASSNSVSLLGERLFVKAYRHVQAGINPELEMGRYLTDVAGYRHCVPVAGSVEYRNSDGTVFVLALLQAQVANQGDAWNFIVDQLTRLLEAHMAGTLTLADGLPAIAERIQVLARRVAELHLALARPSSDAAFAPEPVTAADHEQWAQAVGEDGRQTLAMIAERRAGWPVPLASLAARVARAAPRLFERIARVREAMPRGYRTRLHGDLHLGQILVSQDDFLLIDFEGEPQRPLAERRAKHSALRDVAGMLRSFDYARHTAVQQLALPAPEHERLAAAGHEWARAMRATFLASYAEVTIHGALHEDRDDFAAAAPLLDLFEIERVFYELRYEIDHRPDWIAVPLSGLAAMLADDD
jgi:maltose alpha-D-glucosyltransferase/alpha-amylase